MSATSSGPGYPVTNYVKRRKALSGLFYETALPNEYLVPVGKANPTAVLGGRRFRMFGFRKFLRIPASVQTLEFSTDNANVDFQGLGIEGFAAWQINPEHPVHACETLDLFDAEDPMARTNYELRLICVEAVRHVIANMSIEDAHRRKEEIAEQLGKQLKQVEARWGILFHQVGIRHVKVMSSHVFHDLQSSFRNDLRLQSQRKELETNRRIASEENALRENTEMERLGTDRKVSVAEQENKNHLQENELAGRRRVALAQIENKTVLRETELNEERRLAELEHTVQAQKMELEIERWNKYELPLLELKARAAELEQRIQLSALEVERERRDIESNYTESEQAVKLIETLPAVMGAMRIDSYTVMDGGAGGISPVTKMMQEVMSVLKTGGAAELLESLRAAPKSEG